MIERTNSLDDKSSRRSAYGERIWLPRAAAIAGFLYFLTHSLRVIFGSESKVMEWLYDDAFYYLITAKHFSEQHISSFDGVTRTSGYHPLWMWLCALVYGLRGRLDLTYVRACMGLALSISLIPLSLALVDAWRRRRAGLLWALGLAACSYSALNNASSVMEWPLVILCWYLLHCLLVPRNDFSPGERLPRIACVACFLVGFAGSLSRTDFGLIPACYLAAGLLMAVRQRIWSPALRALGAVGGAAMGLLLVFVYDERMTGSWMQGSARVKRLAASVSTPFNPIPALFQFLRVLFFLPAMDLDAARKARLIQGSLILLLSILSVAAVGVVVARKRLAAAIASAAVAPRPARPAERFALLAALLGVASYASLYAFNTQATYGWYSATVTGFILILAARVFRSLRAAIAAAVVLPLMLANIMAAEWFGGNARAQWLEITCGKAMHLDHPSAVMGGGDVGKPSFYTGGTMFNLDGLMNNEVLPYISNGTLPCYVLHRRIEYLSNLGTTSVLINNAERVRQGKPPIPLDRYFTPAADSLPNHPPNMEHPYLKTDFAAIRASGECPDN